MHKTLKQPNFTLKLTKARSGHKCAFTRLRKKVHELALGAFHSPGKLFKVQALITVMQYEVIVMHRLDAEVKLFIDHEAELTVDPNQTTEDHVSKSISKN